MDKLTGINVRRMVVAWAVFLTGLGLLLGLHTFRDRLFHQAIGPLFLVLWVLLLALVWDGCKGARPRLRYVLMALQVAASVVLCLWFFQYLINQSV